ncbi:MAG: hypothetical protein ABUJ98_15470 [Hyphomicrobium sp.]
MSAGYHEHKFKRGKCTECGMSEGYADYTRASCSDEDIGIIPLMTNVVEPFDAEREADDLFRGAIQVFSDTAWRRDRNGIVRVGISLRRDIIRALERAYQHAKEDTP